MQDEARKTMVETNDRLERMGDAINKATIGIVEVNGKIDRLTELVQHNARFAEERAAATDRDIRRIEDRELAGLRADLREHKTANETRFNKLEEGIENVKRESGAIALKIAGWAGAITVLAVIAQHFLPKVMGS